jgi:hypothetical protein
VFQFENGTRFHLLSLLIPKSWSLGKVRSPPLLGTVERQLARNLVDKSCHSETLYNKTCSRLMHGGQKLASRIVNAGDLPYVDFDLSARTRRGAPNCLGFPNPGAVKSA